MGGLEVMMTASNYLYGQEECRLSVVGKFFCGGNPSGEYTEDPGR